MSETGLGVDRQITEAFFRIGFDNPSGSAYSSDSNGQGQCRSCHLRRGTGVPVQSNQRLQNESPEPGSSIWAAARGESKAIESEIDTDVKVCVCATFQFT